MNKINFDLSFLDDDKVSKTIKYNPSNNESEWPAPHAPASNNYDFPKEGVSTGWKVFWGIVIFFVVVSLIDSGNSSKKKSNSHNRSSSYLSTSTGNSGYQQPSKPSNSTSPSYSNSKVNYRCSKYNNTQAARLRPSSALEQELRTLETRAKYATTEVEFNRIKKEYDQKSDLFNRKVEEYNAFLQKNCR